MATLLVIDNYDSFTYNLVQMFKPSGLVIRVCRNDSITIAEAKALKPDYILVSPGPKDPSHAGISIPIIRAFFRSVPILGVCLGMQCINELFGGRTVRAADPMHGKSSPIFHKEQALFQGLPSPFHAARYHSLVVQPGRYRPGQGLHVTARTRDGVVMGLSHPRYPLHGVQFHPESFLTECGSGLVENFLRSGPLHKHRLHTGKGQVSSSRGACAIAASPCRFSLEAS